MIKPVLLCLQNNLPIGSMIKKNLFTSVLSLCEKYHIESRKYHTGDIVIDHESNHNLYVFASWWYTVWSESAFWWMHQVGEVDSPSVIGEGIFYGAFKKPIRVVTEQPWTVYILTEKTIALIAKENIRFYEILMRSCLAVTNERIQEANTERTLGYALVDALETHSIGNIHTLLTVLKDTFSLSDVMWIERHEILSDIFAVKYRESHGNIPVNERIDLLNRKSKVPYTLPEFIPGKFAHVYPLLSWSEYFGYIIFLSPKERLPGYVTRIIIDMIPNCIRIIESGWKKSRN